MVYVASTPNHGASGSIQSRFVYVMAFAAAMGGLLFGYEIGVISQVLEMPGFKLQWEMSVLNRTARALADGPNKTSVPAQTTFFFLLGCFFGALVVSYMADILGRKKSIMIGGSGFLVGGFLQTVSSMLGLFMTGRFISGLGIGVLSMCAPLYISEAAPTEIRGRLVTVQQLMITIGIFIASIINSIIIVTLGKTSFNAEWRTAMGMQLVPAILLLVTMFFMPESPRWLASKNRDSEALEVIARIRGEDPSAPGAIAEYKTIQDSVAAEHAVGDGSWSELLVPGLKNRLVIVCILQFWQQWTGINVILYYQTTLLQGMGIDPQAASIPFTLANNFINFIATFPGMYMIERMGRKKLLVLGGFGMGLAHLLVCIFVGASKNNMPYLSWGAIFSVYLFFFCFASTWGPVVWAYQSEVFPLRVRAKGTGAGTMSNWFWNAVIAFVTPFITEKIDFYMYIIFAVTGVSMGVFVYFFVPETMGLGMEEIDAMFGYFPTKSHYHPQREKAQSYQQDYEKSNFRLD